MCASRTFPGGAFWRRAALGCVGFALAALQPVWAGDVTVYERVPSVEELQQKLLGKDREGQMKIKTRAIVFDESVEAAQPAAVPAATQPAPAAPQAAASLASAYAPPAAAGGGQTAQQVIQVSKTAVAFPIQFRVNSAKILPESIPYLESIAGLMHQNQGVRLLIEGHTDISGSYQRNLALSRERAMAVMHYLSSRYGIDSSRLMPLGKGPLEPLPGLEPTDPKNRRVQFRIIS